MAEMILELKCKDILKKISLKIAKEIKTHDEPG
jgi:hypothetical protein